MAVSLTACGGGTGSAGGTEGTKSAGQEAETDSGQVSADAAVVDGVEELTLTLSHHCSEGRFQPRIRRGICGSG